MSNELDNMCVCCCFCKHCDVGSKFDIYVHCNLQDVDVVYDDVCGCYENYLVEDNEKDSFSDYVADMLLAERGLL